MLARLPDGDVDQLGHVVGDIAGFALEQSVDQGGPQSLVLVVFVDQPQQPLDAAPRVAGYLFYFALVGALEALVRGQRTLFNRQQPGLLVVAVGSVERHSAKANFKPEYNYTPR